jgi:hypothetical protein
MQSEAGSSKRRSHAAEASHTRSHHPKPSRILRHEFAGLILGGAVVFGWRSCFWVAQLFLGRVVDFGSHSLILGGAALILGGAAVLPLR